MSNIEEEYQNFFSSKNVAIVGPSSVMDNSGCGDLIDSFDIVVRMNRALPIKNTEDFGSRTDILYNNLDAEDKRRGAIDPEMWKSCGVKYVSSLASREVWYSDPSISEPYRDQFPIRWIPDKIYDSLHRQINGRTNAGTMLIYDILQTKMSKMFILGLDFHRFLYTKDYYKNSEYDNAVNCRETASKMLTSSSSGHDPDSQYMWFKNSVFRKDPRVFVQKYFREILENDQYDKMF